MRTIPHTSSLTEKDATFEIQNYNNFKNTFKQDKTGKCKEQKCKEKKMV